MKAQYPVISIIGGTIWGNRGAESMLTTTIGMIRESFPDTKFYVYSYLPKKDRELISDPNIFVLSGKPVSMVTRHFIGALLAALMKSLSIKIPKSNFFKIAKAMDESDLLLDVGGITFSDGREKYLPFNILTIWPAMILNVPVIKLAQAVGPFHHFLNRISARLFLMPCRHIFARGEKTAGFLKELGYPEEKTDTVADVAFLYDKRFSLSHENEKRVADLIDRLKHTKKQIVVFTPSILVENQSTKLGLDYSGKFFDVIKDLGTVNYHFVFMPNATREGSDKTHNNDLLTIGRMRAAAENGALSAEMLEAVDWINYDINTSSIRTIVSAANILVTSRYHAMISGLCLAVPTVVIGWGHKYKETMDYFGLGKYSLDFGDKELDLTQIIKDALDQQGAIHNQIKQNIGNVIKKAEIQFDFIKRELSK
jgi:polysaccharide pyruvyl transferase WcaK-like protein